MGNRKEDIRIYVISGLFFACSIGGGIFLCLYIFLPDSESVPWYPIVGMVLVATPWVFWFLIYLYKCFRPMNVQFHERQNHSKNAGTPKSAPTTSVTGRSGEDSPTHSPTGAGGQHHVHFGAVVVAGNKSGGGEQRQHEAAMDHHEKFSNELPTYTEPKEVISSSVTVGSRESERPLTSVIPS